MDEKYINVSGVQACVEDRGRFQRAAEPGQRVSEMPSLDFALRVKF